MKIIPVILSGGSGQRLWPLSREHFPKQCFALADNKYSLLQQTINRTSTLEMAKPIVVCHEEHRFLIAQQLQDLGQTDNQIILEPCGRNTAPAIALAALEAQYKEQKETLLLVLPADHVIRNIGAFASAIKKAAKLTKSDALITFGIQPTRPETGYGYIRKDNNDSVIEFVEKPNAKTAEQYLASGDYLWNSGMFLFNTKTYLNELSIHRSDILEATRLAYADRTQDMDFIRVGIESFHDCPAESIDYAVMEHTKKAKVVSYIGDWSDIGTWDALYNYTDKDKHNNVLSGDVLYENSSNCLIRSENRLVAAIGVNNLVIVETSDAVLVMNKNNAQDVKKIVKRMQIEEREECINHTIVHRPWGTYQKVDSAEHHQIKRIIVKPGERLSVQIHHHRAEHWVVVSGVAKVQNGDQEFMLTENQSTYIPVGTIHTLENPSEESLELIEVQTGSYFGEDDIIRLDDRYGR